MKVGEVYGCNAYGGTYHICVVDSPKYKDLDYTKIHFSRITLEGIHPIVTIWEASDFARNFYLEETMYVVGHEK